MKIKNWSPLLSVLWEKTIKITDSASARELHPSLEEQLKEFRKYLVESTNEMAPLKVWQLQGNGNSGLTTVLSVCFVLLKIAELAPGIELRWSSAYLACTEPWVVSWRHANQNLYCTCNPSSYVWGKMIVMSSRPTCAIEWNLVWEGRLADFEWNLQDSESTTDCIF